MSPRANAMAWLMIAAVGVCVLALGAGSDWMIGYLPLVTVVVGSATFLYFFVRRWNRQLNLLMAFGAVALGVSLSGIPEGVRLRIEEPRIVAAGQQVLEGEAPGRAGSYRILDSWTVRDCAVMSTQSFFIDDHGVAYCEQAPASDLLQHRFGKIYTYSLVD